jgi:hypothetical protein
MSNMSNKILLFLTLIAFNFCSKNALPAAQPATPNECVICLDFEMSSQTAEMDQARKAEYHGRPVKLPCGHKVHYNCLVKYQFSKSRYNCPLCERQISWASKLAGSEQNQDHSIRLANGQIIQPQKNADGTITLTDDIIAIAGKTKAQPQKAVSQSLTQTQPQPSTTTEPATIDFDEIYAKQLQAEFDAENQARDVALARKLQNPNAGQIAKDELLARKLARELVEEADRRPQPARLRYLDVKRKQREPFSAAQAPAQTPPANPYPAAHPVSHATTPEPGQRALNHAVIQAGSNPDRTFMPGDIIIYTIGDGKYYYGRISHQKSNRSGFIFVVTVIDRPRQEFLIDNIIGKIQ